MVRLHAGENGRRDKIAVRIAVHLGMAAVEFNLQPSAMPFSIRPSMRDLACLEITGPTSVPGTVPPLIVKRLGLVHQVGNQSLYLPTITATDVAMHRCPAAPKPRRRPKRSASAPCSHPGMTMVHGQGAHHALRALAVSGESLYTCSPAWHEPTNETAWIVGCVQMASPPPLPPCTMFSAPGGTPRLHGKFGQQHGRHRVLLRKASNKRVAADDGHGEHPQRNHGRGLNGVMPAHTPIGWRMKWYRRPRDISANSPSDNVPMEDACSTTSSPRNIALGIGQVLPCSAVRQAASFSCRGG